MARVLVSLVVLAGSLRDVVRAHWRRLLVGAFVGWATATVLGAVLLALATPVLAGRSSDAVAVGLVYGGILLGVVTAYALRDDGRQA